MSSATLTLVLMLSLVGCPRLALAQTNPQHETGRMVVAPRNAGETWQGVRDPAEMVCALRLALPSKSRWRSGCR